jgi:hypothetical protein
MNDTLIVRVGFFAKGNFKSFIMGLIASGADLEFSSGHGPCGQDWHFKGDKKIIDCIRNYCE